MQTEILTNLDNPKQLEKLYRADQSTFKTAFNSLYPQLPTNLLAEGWYQRLNYSSGGTNWGTAEERVFVIGGSLLAAFLAKLPDILQLNPDSFYRRNVGFITFPLLIAYFVWKHKISRPTSGWLVGFMLAAVVYINLLPPKRPSDTLSLACIHLPLCLWALLGFAFGGGKLNRNVNWLGFLRYNAELIVVSALLLLACGVMSGLTIGLFEVIGWHIGPFYVNYAVVCGLAAIPILGTFLTQTQPTLVTKVAPVIANLFSPLALVMLVIYLIATVYSGKNPYHDREFLLLFNLLLVGVMALIFFSVAETDPARKRTTQLWILLLLSTVTILVNGIALSAVIFRITEGGITPNRAAVLGANVLMLSHLGYIAVRLFGALTRKADVSLVGQSMTYFLPVYGLWSALVTFLFPLLFGFR